ncbi:hypothetical protein [Devosia faecipullorum]|uniref:hypothetical protein n=1 Tax=Devosia faecipullorum TaxID=2755039 RepID=UPI00187B4CB2|nr:hypothetical protein [Devosia faecipullorum]MBE7733941.1 hypothetical protein [Devosia faecipullorum]
MARYSVCVGGAFFAFYRREAPLRFRSFFKAWGDESYDARAFAFLSPTQDRKMLERSLKAVGVDCRAQPIVHASQQSTRILKLASMVNEFQQCFR